MQLIWPRPDITPAFGTANVTFSGRDPMAEVKDGWVVTAYGNVSTDKIRSPHGDDMTFIAISRLSFLFFDQACLLDGGADAFSKYSQLQSLGEGETLLGGCILSLSLYATGAVCCSVLLVLILVLAARRRREGRTRPATRETNRRRTRALVPTAASGTKAWCLDFWGVTTEQYDFQARLKAWALGTIVLSFLCSFFSLYIRFTTHEQMSRSSVNMTTAKHHHLVVFSPEGKRLPKMAAAQGRKTQNLTQRLAIREKTGYVNTQTVSEARLKFNNSLNLSLISFSAMLAAYAIIVITWRDFVVAWEHRWTPKGRGGAFTSSEHSSVASASSNTSETEGMSTNRGFCLCFKSHRVATLVTLYISMFLITVFLLGILAFSNIESQRAFENDATYFVCLMRVVDTWNCVDIHAGTAMFVVAALYLVVSFLMLYYGVRLHLVVSSLYAQSSRSRTLSNGHKEHRRIREARCLALKIIVFAAVTCILNIVRIAYWVAWYAEARSLLTSFSWQEKNDGRW